MANFDFVLKTRSSLHPEGEPTEFISEHTGIITCTDEDTGKISRVGRVNAIKLHAGLAASYGEPLFNVCDAHSQELHVLHTLLYKTEGYNFCDDLVRRFEAMEPNLLILDYAVFAPKWRGLKLGLLAVRKMVDLLGGGCGLAVSLIAPLRTDAHRLLKIPASWLPLHESKEARQAAAVRLRQHYRQMGFRRLWRTPYYALSMNQRMPTAADLLRRRPGRD